MKFNKFGGMINYIYTNILQDSYEKNLTISFDPKATLVEVFESGVVIIIHKKNYKDLNGEETTQLIAELDTELLRENLNAEELRTLVKILDVLNDNIKFFKEWMEI